MAGFQEYDNDEGITGINVTPLVDVMLVLLIIFMVTTSYIVNKGIQVKLPTAETGEEISSTRNLAIVLDKKSQLYLDGKPLNFQELEIQLKEIKNHAGTQNLQALISADTSLPFGEAINLIDLVRKSGINDFAINIASNHSKEPVQTQEKE